MRDPSSALYFISFFVRFFSRMTTKNSFFTSSLTHTSSIIIGWGVCCFSYPTQHPPRDDDTWLLPHYYRGRKKHRDMEVALNKIVPGSWTNDGTFRHTMEGEDDMPGHVKSSLMGASLNIPVSMVCRVL